MVEKPDIGTLLASSYALPRGPRVRLRLPQRRDLDGVRRLFVGAGGPADELDVARLVLADPRQALVICATGLVEGRERVLGFGAMALGDERAGREPVVVVDPEVTSGLDDLLLRALRSHSQSRRHQRAA